MSDKKNQSRMGRFAKLSSMTAGFAARQVGQKIRGAFQDEEEQAREESRVLTESARTIAEGLGELKGAAMKVGQLLSQDQEILPPEVADAFSVLQKDAPPMGFDVVTEEIETAYGVRLDEVFAHFDEEPIGSASIGQVHRATLRTGEDVAVKIQYPGIADTIESDMKNLGAVFQIARVKLSKERLDMYLAEVTETLRNESDYLREADNLERFQTIVKSLDNVRVPNPHFDWCRKNILVMDFIEGEQLTSWIRAAHKHDKEDMATRLIHSYVTMMHDHGVLHADPHPGNLIVTANNELVFLDLGCVREYSQSFCDGLVKTIIAMWRHDTEALLAGIDACGFAHEGVDIEVIYEWLVLVLEPLLSRGIFVFSEWRAHDAARQFIKRNPELLGFHPPREALFYLRVLAGLRGVLGVEDLALDVRALARAAVKERGYTL